jgi:hypothetical protein
MNTPESPWGPTCFPTSELSFAPAAETADSNLGQFAANTFIRVSRKYPASVTAQAAAVALESHADNTMPPLRELAGAFLTDTDQQRRVVAVANRVHETARPDGDDVTPGRVRDIFANVFELAQLMRNQLPADEIERIQTHHLTLSRNERVMNRLRLKLRLSGVDKPLPDFEPKKRSVSRFLWGLIRGK